MNRSDSDTPRRDANVDAPSDLSAALASVRDVLQAGCGWAVESLSAWLGWTDRTGPETRTDAPVSLRALPGGAGAAPRARTTEAPRPATHHAPTDATPARAAADDRPVDEAVERDEVVVLVRDPRSVFVFWSLTRESVARRKGLRGAASDSAVPCALRIEAQGDDEVADAESVWTVPLAPGAASAHVDLLRPRRSVRVVLGVGGDDRPFTPLAASHRVPLPPATPFPYEPPLWRRLGGDAAAAPPEAPSAEDCALLAARAAESDTATSSTLPIAHHVIGLERGVGAATPR